MQELTRRIPGELAGMDIAAKIPSIRVVVIAYHHLSENIASLRFRELLSHIDDGVFEVHVIANGDAGTPEGMERSRLHVVGGGMMRAGLFGVFDYLGMMASLLLPNLTIAFKGQAWWQRGLPILKRLHAESRAIGQNMVVVASYSPVESLVMGAVASSGLNMPLVLDFRDGLAFESLGRPGKLAAILRRAMEWLLVRRANVLTTVSHPIVDYFERTYPRRKVVLLPNGFDPKLKAMFECQDQTIPPNLAKAFPSGKFVLAHFGRVGASDESRGDALRFFVDTMRKLRAPENLHVLFMGALKENEVLQLSRLPCSIDLIPPSARDVAQAAMSEADVLLLLTGTSKGCATGKIFEYLASGKLICQFSSAPNNEAGRILQETGAGVTISPFDADAAHKLECLIAGSERPIRKPSMIDAYRRDVQARRLEELLVSLGGDSCVAQGGA